MGWLTWVLLAGAVLYVMLSLVLPMGTLLLASFQGSNAINFDFASWTLRNYKYVMFDFPTTRQAIVNSRRLSHRLAMKPSGTHRKPMANGTR